jgi:hypothetical protein
MSNIAFPTFTLQTLVSREPLTKSTVQKTASGAELRVKRLAPGYRYTLDITCFPGSTEHTTLTNFFLARDGMTDSFRFTDPVDSVERYVRFDSDDLPVNSDGATWSVTVELVTVVV